MLETGRRLRDNDPAKTGWNLRRVLRLLALRRVGPTHISLFKDVFIASVAGVGGGSLVYANTLYRAKPPFFAHPQRAGLNDRATPLQPHCAAAERTLGVQIVPENQVLDIQALGGPDGLAHPDGTLGCVIRARLSTGWSRGASKAGAVDWLRQNTSTMAPEKPLEIAHGPAPAVLQHWLDA